MSGLALSCHSCRATCAFREPRRVRALDRLQEGYAATAPVGSRFDLQEVVRIYRRPAEPWPLDDAPQR